MSNIVERSIRLTPKPTSELNNFTGNSGEIFLDANTLSLRIFNGRHSGGYELLRADLSNLALPSDPVVDFGDRTVQASTFDGNLSGNVAGNVTGNLTGNVAGNVTGNLTGNVAGNVTGNLTGNVVGNLTGNVTGNVSGNAGTVTNGVYNNQTYSNPDWIDSIAGSKVTGDIGGNSSTTTALKTSRTINAVGFDGTANITIPTLVNGSHTLSLSSTGSVTIPSSLNLSTVASVKTESNNAVLESTSGNTIVRASGVSSWTFGSNGTLTAPGTITTTGTVSASAAVVTTVTSSTASVTNDVTVGANVNIQTAPTEVQHATNKNYVDTRALAMSIALS